MSFLKRPKKTKQLNQWVLKCLFSSLAMVSLSACAADSTVPTPAESSKTPITAVTSIPSASLPASAVSGFTSGVHYLEMGTSLIPAEKVKVVEFFSYGCPHCFELEKHIEPWLEKEKLRVDFQRNPSAWNPSLELLSQAYFTVKLLKREDTLHAALFNAVHRERLNLQSLDAMRIFFVREGVTAEVFDQTFESFAVKQKVFQAKSAFEKYNLNSVPSFVVADHFVTDVGKAGGHDKLLQLLSHLVDLSKIPSESKKP
jgi:thiol:disulfide interchange protein DsbA